MTLSFYPDSWTLGPLFSVVVSSYESHLTELEAFLAAEHPNHRCSFRTMVREASASPESQSNAVLWAAFAEQLKLVAPSLHDAWWLETRYSSARTIPSDMVTAPNEILAALGAFGLPVFDGEPTPAGERTRLSVASAREVLGRRWLGALQAREQMTPGRPNVSSGHGSLDSSPRTRSVRASSRSTRTCDRPTCLSSSWLHWRSPNSSLCARRSPRTLMASRIGCRSERFCAGAL